MINHETTARVVTYLKKEVVAKLDAEAMERGMSRSQIIGIMLDAYILQMEMDEAEGVRENEKK